MASTGVGPPEFPGSNNRHRGGGRSDLQTKPRLSPDELRVLQECNRESFYYRCLPICTVSMIATHYAVTFGYLRRSAKYGSLLKVLGVGAIGYFVGKLSYRRTCEEKIMQLPNSRLAEALRRRKQGLPMSLDSLITDPAYAADGASDANSADNVMGLGGSGTWEINAGDNVDFQGMDDLQRPSIDNPMSMSDDEKSSQSDHMYEALRKRNREDYEERHANVLYDRNRSEPQRSSGDQSRLPPPPSSSSRTSSSSSGVRNKYGDLVD